VELRLDPDAPSGRVDHASGAMEGLAGPGAGRAAAMRPRLLGEAHRLVHAARGGSRRAGVGRRELAVLRSERAPGAHRLVVDVLEGYQRVPGTPVVRGRVVAAVCLHLDLS